LKLLFLAIALLHAEDCRQVGKPEFGRIEIIAKDFTGAILRIPKIELVEVGSKQSFDIQKPVPYGNYAMRLMMPGFQIIQREIRVYQPNLIVRAEFSVRGECEGPESIHGRVKSPPAGRELFVKIVSVLGTGGGESRVGPSGDFLIGGLDFGNYLLIVMDGNKAIHTETVTAMDSKSLVIDI
jgi:hypothetical protein